jgi:hypothetical protein
VWVGHVKARWPERGNRGGVTEAVTVAEAVSEAVSVTVTVTEAVTVTGAMRHAYGTA